MYIFVDFDRTRERTRKCKIIVIGGNKGEKNKMAKVESPFFNRKS